MLGGGRKMNTFLVTNLLANVFGRGFVVFSIK
jgi:hypothetical protein